MTLPILYSLRNCPYAMRARLAIYKSGLSIELRDIVLKNKPQEMLTASPKGTVPTVVLADGRVIDESFDVMLWALNLSDPQQLMRSSAENIQTGMIALVQQFDSEFKTSLEAYKCAKRYHESNVIECRQACEVLLALLEQRLQQHGFIIDDQESLADIAILPFIRQFAKVDRPWFKQAPYPKLRQWLEQYLQSAMFTKVMAKYPLWEAGQPVTVFGKG